MKRKGRHGCVADHHGLCVRIGISDKPKQQRHTLTHTHTQKTLLFFSLCLFRLISSLINLVQHILSLLVCQCVHIFYIYIYYTLPHTDTKLKREEEEDLPTNIGITISKRDDTKEEEEEEDWI